MAGRVQVERPEGSTVFRNGFTEEAMDTWCVWSKFGKRPIAFHDTREIAESEAQRLAEKVPGCKFLVLHVVSKFCAPKIAQPEDPPHGK